ncbi:filamentous hemagglutinin N-terminal domain-containing protein [Desulfococcaceae bacterium HSG8]|nr:filamentous hemagglutinin N-terminal domain-containing protein [Desulfococcaceae bacterium HSG8]
MLKHAAIFVFLGLICGFATPGALAQITLDGTLGPAGDLSGPDYQIGAELGQQTGPNLFHSFGQFNINTGESALFTGPDSVSNIITRVTGGTASWIDGPLGSGIPGADMFFLNPGGVMFGPNASLDISGSFHITTADYLRLGRDGRFDAVQTENTVLTTARPSAFGFLGHGSGDISVGGTLVAPQGETLSLTGGNVNITAGIMAVPDGQISIASTAGAGEAGLGDSEPDISSFEHQGDISVSDGSILEVSDSGKISIRGGRFIVSTGSYVAARTSEADGRGIDIRVSDALLTDGGQLYSDTLGNGDAGDISILADSLALANEGLINSASGALYADDEGQITAIGGTGRGGDVLIDTGSLEMSGGGAVISSAMAQGSGGNISATVRETAVISGYGSFSRSGFFSEAGDTGDAGNVEISARALSISDEGVINTAAGGTGRGGNVVLQADYLDITDGGYVMSSTLGPGRGGDISVNAEDAAVISGQGSQGSFSSGLFATAEPGSTGDAGSIEIFAGTLTVSDQGTISGETYGAGHGSNIVMNADHLGVTGGGSISASSLDAGHSGDISVTAQKSVTISGTGTEGANSVIQASSIGTGDAGSITVSTDILTITDNGAFLASTGMYFDGSIIGGEGRGGDITLDANRVEMDRGYVSSSGMSLSPEAGRGGDISITAREAVNISGSGTDDLGSNLGEFYGVYSQTQSSGHGGTITIKTDELNISEDGLINVETYGEGQGGNVMLDVNRLKLNQGGALTTVTRGPGRAGDISITSGDSVTISTPGAKNPETGIFAETLGSGDGGNITIKADRLALSDSGFIAAKSSETGNAGDIFITPANTIQIENSTITTQAENAGGGRMTITVRESLRLSDGEITTSVREGAGNGGDITINPKKSGAEPPEFIIMDNSSIIAKAYRGNGGNIDITANHFIQSSGSEVDASSELGIDGSVEIESPDEDVSTGLIILPANYLDVTRWMKTPCAARSAEKVSRFVIKGPDGVPTSSDDWQPSLLAWPDSTHELP